MEFFTLIIYILIFISQSNSQIWNGVSFNMVGGWDLDTGGYLSPFWTAHSSSVNCIRFLSTYVVVTGSSDFKLYVWDISSGTEIKKATFNGHSGSVNCCDKLLNGNVVSAGDDKNIYIWNPANGNSVTSKSNAHSTKILCLKVLSNGNIATGAANGDTNIKIWSPSLGTELNTLYSHGNDVLVIDQLSNGNLISGSADFTFIIWNMTTNVNQQLIHRSPISYSDSVNCLKELPDGNIAFAGGSSKAIYTWNIAGQSVSNLVATSANIINTTPCQAMLLYNSSYLAVASSGTETYLVNVKNSTNLRSVKTLTIPQASVTCLENQDSYFTTTTKITTTTTTTKSTTTTLTSTTTSTISTTTTKTSSSSTTSSSTITTSISTTTISTLTTTTTIISTTTTTSTKTTTTTVLSGLIDLNMTVNPIVFNSQFTLADITIQEYVAILNSKYDISDCIVNCSNHGMCKYSGNGTFTCACQGDYGGKTCQQNLLPCSKSPCLNNGTCYQNSTSLNQTADSYYCECNPLYYGTNCEYKIDICQNKTCSSNGVCKDVNSIPTCQCFLNYYGDKCQSETSQQKTIKTVTSTASIIAIATLVTFYSLIVISDLMNFFCISSTTDKSSKNIVYNERKLIYVP